MTGPIFFYCPGGGLFDRLEGGSKRRKPYTRKAIMENITELTEDSRAGYTNRSATTPSQNKRKRENITELTDIPKKKQQPAFNWVFTWYNFPANWQDYFKERESQIQKLCVGEEKCPTTGTPHLQGWLRLYKKNTAKTHLSLPDKIHWEPMSRNATEKQNTIYCTKERTNILSWGTPMPWKRNITLKPWMKELQTILQSPLEEGTADRDIYWIWEPYGKVGKTYFCQYIYQTEKAAIVIEGRATDIKHHVSECSKRNGMTPRIVFMDIPRMDQEFISYGAIEKVKNMFFFSGKYEGGTVDGPRPHLIVFANCVPDKSKMSEDRWKIGRIVDEQIEWA